MSRILYAHNIDLAEFADQNYDALYTQRRRDANFAGAIQHGDKIHAFRDHLGIVPLFYRHLNDNVEFSTRLSDLLTSDATLNREGVRAYVKLGTTRLQALFKEIHIVPPASVIEIDPHQKTTRSLYVYHLNPLPIPNQAPWDDLLGEFENLFVHALESQIQHDQVGLYLSGGIDSALIGVYLKKLGVDVHAYTSGPWGTTSSDVKFAKMNADIIGIQHHEIHYLETSEYNSAISALPEFFGLPHGTPTGLGIVKLWENTTIGQQPQLFFGQNCDTIMANVRAQSLSYFLQFLPQPIRRRIHPAFVHSTAVENYIHLARNYGEQLSKLVIPTAQDDLNQIQNIITAGMYIGQTPSSSEVFTQPSIVHNQPIANPYHNMDIVEYVMGIPFDKRFSLRDGKRWFPSFDKHLMRRFAHEYFPQEIVLRTKAFVVSFIRDERSRTLYDNLPSRLYEIPLQKTNERFAGEILLRWLANMDIPSQV